MLNIRLEGPHGRWSTTLAPSKCIRVVGGSLRSGPRDEEIAVFSAGSWHRARLSGTLSVLSGPYRAVAIDSATAVRFEDPDRQETSGEYDAGGVRIENVQLRLANGEDRILARYDETLGQWYCASDRKHWPVLVFTEPRIAAREASASGLHSTG